MVISLAVTLPSTIPAVSIDATIAIAVGLVVAYSVMAGHMALVREAISIYVGLVLAASFGNPLFHYLEDAAGSNFPVTEVGVRLVILILPIVLLQFGRHHAKHAKKHNIVVTLLLALATAMLLVSSVLTQLDSVTLAHTTDQSSLASWIYDFRLLWLALVPIGIAASALVHPKPKHH